jgi:hypothetical protein
MHIDYDTYARMSPLQKNRVIHQIAAENVAELVTTHWQRFLDKNRGRLNVEQIRFIEESIAFVRPEHYKLPRDEEAIRKHGEELERRLEALFSFVDRIHLHMGAFKNSGEIPNLIARTLVRTRPHFDESSGENLQMALHDLATVPRDELRKRHSDLPEILSCAFEGMPSGDEFWDLVADEDVPLAASRAFGMVKSMRIQNPIASGEA